ncbi:MAG: glycogen synthase [Myxococcales bacterium]|nr:glycogen synthase [Myxococcales bacterium]
MDILFAVTELAPYVKVGGLADVALSLTKALRALGHKVTVIVPRFPGFEAGGLLVARRLTPLRLAHGDATVEVTLYDGRLASQVDLLLVDVPSGPALWNRPHVYGPAGEEYPDNARRFAVFSRAVAEVARLRAREGMPFDVVHLNDWPTALAAKYMQDARVEGTRTVLTLHNAAHQGVFPKEAMTDLGLPWSDFTVEGLEFYGDVSLLKQGIVSADVVSTVSPHHAAELVTAAGGFRLDGVLRAKGRLTGVLNGVDYAVWNPATDPHLPARYDAEDPSAKARCKAAFRKELGLSLQPDGAPLIVSVGRLVAQKGTDLLLGALPRLLRSTDAQVVVCGDGDAALIEQLEAAATKSRGRVAFLRAAPEAVVHRAYAAADLVVVPSRYEPCGLVQLYAQRYGALPVAHATGGLVDTVVDCDAKLQTGTGFSFDEPTEEALIGAVLRALAAREHPAFPALVRRVMRADRGWERAARQYEALYRAATRASSSAA